MLGIGSGPILLVTDIATVPCCQYGVKIISAWNTHYEYTKILIGVGL